MSSKEDGLNNKQYMDFVGGGFIK